MPSNSPWSTFALIALMVVAFYFLILRPQKRRQQDQQRTMNAIVPGTRVMTGSGLFGTVVSVGDKQVVLEISPGVELTVLKQAVVRIATEADEDGIGGVDLDEDDVIDDQPEAPAAEPNDASLETDVRGTKPTNAKE
jgi:preprotein translocase subunit YajC